MGRHIIEEANRCLQCKKALCRKGCPVDTPLSEAIGLLLKGEIKEAGEQLFRNNPLSVVCSLICPHERFCEGHCVLGKKGNPVQTSSIEHYISSYYLDKMNIEVTPNPKKRVAIIGSGPAGITVAIILATRGYDITIFEAEEKIGGILYYGIPEYRLPKKILSKLRNVLIKLGVKIRPNTMIGSVITLDTLFEDGYKAVFIGTGVWKPRPLRIKGESLGHVHFAINYLKNPDVYRLGKRVAIIGAGNVAMDVARTVLRKGADEAVIVYRKGEEEMPATRYELDYARLDGVKFDFFKSPVEITDEGLIYRETRFEEESEGNKKLVELEQSEALFKADSVIIAVSQMPRANIVSTTNGIEIDKYGLLVTDEYGRTSREGVFASGDVVTGAKTVVEAVKFSKRSAEMIERHVLGEPGIDCVY